MFSLMLITFVFILVTLVLSTWYSIVKIKRIPGNIGPWVTLIILIAVIVLVIYLGILYL
ncbi:hypothetical protein ACFFJI_04305 [Allobacillus sp. GCM10007491]|uniref:Uncharacterized protein n=1 Tax=Allobacillus saliphilus TaxID=2912308 RepID=A0A941CVX3_9BACI|nr:hypothetical protein [Allobacillus saliphilus]MBR7554847.1 hypothetical protein [Allobacillus saliphilus]